MNIQLFEFDSIIKKNPEMDAAYIEMPFDLKKEFGKGKLLVSATFDGEKYSGQIINMGLKNEDGSICYIIGINKTIRAKINKQPGDTIKVTIKEREPDFTTVDEYINRQTGDVKERLIKMRELILSCSQEITEKISWGMPTYVLNGNLVHFSAEKKHMGFHPSPSPIVAFAERLTEYKTSKGTVQFPYDKPMPYDLIREMVMFRVSEQGGK